jgi:PAS domain S-box-containing protein
MPQSLKIKPAESRFHLSHASVGWIVLAVAASLIVCLWVFTTARIHQEREEVLEGEIAKNTNLVLSHERQASSSLKELDQILLMLRSEHYRHGTTRDLNKDLQTLHVDRRNVGIVSFIDEKGQVIVSTADALKGNFSDRDYFKTHATNPDDQLLIGKPLLGRLTGKWLISLTRRLEHADGTFAGVVFLALDPYFIAAEYEKADVGENAALVLAGLDGITRVRKNGGKVSFGEDIRDSQLFKEVLKASHGNYVAASSFDGQMRVVSYSVLHEFPLVVAVASSLEDVMKPLDKREQIFYWIACITTLLIAGVAFLQLSLFRNSRRYVQSLEASEASLREIVEASPVPMALNNDENQITFVNQAFVTTFGYALADIPVLDAWWSAAYPDPAYRQWVIAAWGQELTRAKSTQSQFAPMEIVIRCKDQSHRDVLASATVFVNKEHGQHLVVLYDITERKKVEGELQVLKDNLQTTLDAIPDLLFEVGLDGRIYNYHANRGDLLAAPPEVFMGRAILEFLPQPAANICMAAIQEAAEKGWSVGATYSLDLPQGVTWFELSIAAMKTAAGAEPRFILLSRDVTDRKSAQEALRESESRWRFALEGTGDALWDWDIAGGKMFYSELWKEMLGFASDEIGTDPQEWERHIHPDDREQVLAGLQAHLRGEASQFNCEYRVRRKDGGISWVLGRGLVVRRDAAEQPLRMIGTNSDITGRRNAAAKLQFLSRRILEVQESERRRIAHELHDELGQTLTAVKINLQSIRSNDRRTPQESVAENVRMVDSALQQMRQMALTLRPSVLDDLGLASALDWLGEQVATRSDLQVNVHSAMRNERIAGEIETACFRIVQEALTNIQRHAFATHVEIDLSCNGQTLSLSVSDDGCGFTPDFSSVAERSMGLLGMQERASLIGGHISIESSPGQGCRIRLECATQNNREVEA